MVGKLPSPGQLRAEDGWRRAQLARFLRRAALSLVTTGPCISPSSGYEGRSFQA